MEKSMYPVFRCKNCGENIVIKTKEPFRNLRSISDALNRGFYDNQSNPKLHKCKEVFIPDDEFEFYVALEPVGFVKEKEREEVQNEIRDGELDSGDQKSNREADINQ